MDATWAFDSEFLMSGRLHHPSDVHTVQFSNGNITAVLESDRELKEWLHNHHRCVKTLYGFVVLPDLGSIAEWLGDSHVKIKKRGTQTIGRITYGSARVDVYDVQPMAQSFGLHRLAQIGDWLDIPKLPKPEWLGQRQWLTGAEHQEFLRYAAQDAIITSKFASKLIKLGSDPAKYASAGTLVKQYLALPKRLHGKPIELSTLEAMVKRACYAGRSEGFRTGYIHNVYYNDVSSLYPCSIVATQCMRIAGIQPCKSSDLTISNDLNETNYGWIEGVFSTNNDLWGLPRRGKNNFYATGNQMYGFYHTFDIAASRAEINHVLRAWKPIMRERDFYTRKYPKLLQFRLENPLDHETKAYTKAILNSLSGKLGQSKPIATTSNFFAYNTLLAHSHLIMSNLFEKCPSEILAMDTDSIFTHQDLSGKWYEISDGEYSFPISIGVKGKGDLVFFRSKRYILKGDETVFGAHGWRYFLEDYLKLFDGNITELPTRMDIKHTLMTRQREALTMAKGRWKTKPIVLNLDKLKSLLTADAKRKRTIMDSYELVMNRKSAASQAWDYDDLLVNNPIASVS